MDDKRLYSPSVTKEVIQKYGFKFSKSLGQNFLIDGNIIDNICIESGITDSDFVLEIGPGIGTLTQSLCERAKKVIAIELDRKLLPILEETLSSYDNVEVVHGDVLKIDLESLLREKFKGEKASVVANLPYYITTPIIMRFLEEKINVEKIVVMVQKEVAYRMKANPGNKDYGALSIAVQYYSDPEIILNVPKNVFMPRPNVDSAVIMLNIHKEPRYSVSDEKLLFQIVKAAFGKRRKTLLNALSSSGLGLTKDEVNKALERCGIDPKRRGETLTISEYVTLTESIAQAK
ncbi:16S rRNA (adenine(1518)-N(6)/adenine(1519)-N(6))-dimethyltransferase RsmA [Sporosalibacterium faouarense]|uniref:16S rRNA (adenine(1518)-N(6)/adenine(1519)-N(6))- dimethyltransferase RsmA n=1 Tax=Sporosalibacterium faouarense TaxID=516123 RepID=UPI00192BB0A8|nr:16S rRNA (adenine(1518)-N(6)/adenine(1519)-N(6))-dimethyltransferase RsmA [Sporosalibacterium faouarense]